MGRIRLRLYIFTDLCFPGLPEPLVLCRQTATSQREVFIVSVHPSLRLSLPHTAKGKKTYLSCVRLEVFCPNGGTELGRSNKVYEQFNEQKRNISN